MDVFVHGDIDMRNATLSHRGLVIDSDRHAVHFLTDIITPPPVEGRGIVFARFLSLFLCHQHYDKTWLDRFARNFQGGVE